MKLLNINLLYLWVFVRL